MPIMTKSRACHLSSLGRAALVDLKEEANEMGGFFICNGIERIIRCLIAQVRAQCVRGWAFGAAFGVVVMLRQSTTVRPQAD